MLKANSLTMDAKLGYLRKEALHSVAITMMNPLRYTVSQTCSIGKREIMSSEIIGIGHGYA